MKKVKIPLKTLMVCLGVISLVGEIKAQDTITKDSIREIEEVEIKGNVFRQKNSSTLVNVITTDAVKDLLGEDPMRLLEQIPGVNVISYSQGITAGQFSMRGFGGGGHGGQAGVEVDGVSLNESEGHGDGYSDTNVIIPIDLKRISVYKGPSSALFGRYGQAGTVSFETRKGGNYHDIKLVGGSYNTFDIQYAQGKTIRLGNRENALKTNFAIQLFNTDGYIENSDILKGNVRARVAYKITDKSEIAVSIMGHRSEWNAPGYIPEVWYKDKATRNKPHFTHENDGGNKMFFSQRLDYNYNLADNIKLLLFGYAVQQDFKRFGKFGYSINDKQRQEINRRNAFAFGGSLNGNSKLGNKDFDWITGFEFYSEEADNEKYWTAYRKKTEKTEDRLFDIRSLSLYAQGVWDLHKFFKPTLGLRFDTFRGSYENNDPRKPMTKGKINNLSHVSPKLGFRSTLVENFDFHANVSNGFSLPRSVMKYDEANKLKPIELWQYEAGFSYNNDKNFQFNLVGFILNLSRDIFEEPKGSGIFVNAGKTKRMGIEADAQVKASEGLVFRSSFTYTDTEIKEGPNKGMALTRVPNTIFNLGATYTSPMGLGADVYYRNVSDQYITNDNSLRDGKYNLVNLKLFYNFDKLFSNKGNVFISVNNLFNEIYAEFVSFKPGVGKRYAASPTRNVMLGINYSF